MPTGLNRSTRLVNNKQLLRLGLLLGLSMHCANNLANTSESDFESGFAQGFTDAANNTQTSAKTVKSARTVNSAGANQTAAIQSLVERTVQNAIDTKYPDSVKSISVLPLPGAVSLKPCTQLNAQIKSNTLYGRVPVLVRCAAPVTWSIYAGAQVVVETPVVVTTRGIARGERLSASDLAIVPMALHKLRRQTIMDQADAIGKTARRALNADTPLTLNQLTVPFAVHKGERVHILGTSGRIKIQTFGVALADGRIGEQIQVRNETSKRIIRPWVVATGQVATTAPAFDS